MNMNRNILEGSRVYLSGPMDFVASRKMEKEHGWRARISRFLQKKGVVVFDPWEKPDIVGMPEYGKEGVSTTKIRDNWTFGNRESDCQQRAEIADEFWSTMHIDLRMVDVSDFVIAYCPTNIYSVGTVHEIVVARQQHKPVLFVSPPIQFPAFTKLKEMAAKDAALGVLLDEMEKEIPIKENPKGTPSLWYMSLIGTENFFDGFGFGAPRFKKYFLPSEQTYLDKMEEQFPPERPLLQRLEDLSNGIMPQRWNQHLRRFETDEDWLLMEKAIKTD
jgi:hypothetical protein